MADNADDETPESFLCPLTLEIMTDPVTAADGHSYECAAITVWLQSSALSPLTGEQLPHKQLTRSHALRNAIQEHYQLLQRRQAAASSSSVPAVAAAATAAGAGAAATAAVASSSASSESSAAMGGGPAVIGAPPGAPPPPPPPAAGPPPPPPLAAANLAAGGYIEVRLDASWAVLTEGLSVTAAEPPHHSTVWNALSATQKVVLTAGLVHAARGPLLYEGTILYNAGWLEHIIAKCAQQPASCLALFAPLAERVWYGNRTQFATSRDKRHSYSHRKRFYKYAWYVVFGGPDNDKVKVEKGLCYDLSGALGAF